MSCKRRALFELRGSSVNTFFAERVQNQQKKKEEKEKELYRKAHTHTLMNQHDFKVPFSLHSFYVCLPQRISRKRDSVEQKCAEQILMLQMLVVGEEATSTSLDKAHNIG